MITRFGKIKKRTSTNYFLAAIILIFVFLAIGFLLVSNIKIKQERKKLDLQIESIEKQTEELQKKNEEMKKGISQMEQEEYIEKIAREELNLQKEGEKVVGFILPPEQKEGGGENKGTYIQNFWQWLKEKWEQLKE